MARKVHRRKPKRLVAKPHLCFDRLPESEAQLIAWADQACEYNPHNAPQRPAAQAYGLSTLASVEPTRLEAASWTTKRWKVGDEITYGFMRASQRTVSIVRDAVSTLKEFVNLRFRETDAASAIVRIINLERGAYANIGTDCLGVPRNQETMCLAQSWADLATALHEWCHILSLIHEHQSPARPDNFWNEPAAYRSYAGPPNNWDRETIKRNVIDKYSQTVITQYTTFDRKSIMLYPLDAALLNDPSLATGWNKELSATDKQFLSSIYPFPTTPPPVGRVSIRLSADLKAGNYELTPA